MLSDTNTDCIAATGDGMNGAQLKELARKRHWAARRAVQPCEVKPAIRPVPQARIMVPNEGNELLVEERRARRLMSRQNRYEAQLAHLRAVNDLRDRKVIALAAQVARETEWLTAQPSFDLIAKRVELATGITVADMRSASYHRHFTTARHQFFHLARKYTDRSWKEIANFMGGRDHTTPLSAIRGWPARKAKIRAKRRKGTA